MQDGGVYIENLAAKRKEFRKITQNYFEPELEPSPFNKYSLIIDENLSGPAKYFGLIDPQCI